MFTITDTGTDRCAEARRARQRNSANRAVDDPRQLARAARIVRAALERGRLAVDDIAPDASAAA